MISNDIGNKWVNKMNPMDNAWVILKTDECEHDWSLEQSENDEGMVNVWLVCSICSAEAGPTHIPITEQGTPPAETEDMGDW